MKNRLNAPSKNTGDTSPDLATLGWLSDLPDRLGQQMKFLIAIDALKSINRASRLVNGGRFENSAEHSWHLTLFARILAEHANDLWTLSESFSC